MSFTLQAPKKAAATQKAAPAKTAVSKTSKPKKVNQGTKAAKAAKVAKATKVASAVRKGTNSRSARKIRTSVHFRRPKTLRLDRNPKYPRRSVPRVNKLDKYTILKYPVTTESAMKKIEDNNTLVFIVDVRANKHQIKEAVSACMISKLLKWTHSSGTPFCSFRPLLEIVVLFCLFVCLFVL